MEVDNSVTNYLQQQQRDAPSELARYFSEFEDLYERKQTFINLPEAAAYRVGVYTEF
ncbi:hypothetical protein GGF38_000729, partial [Coemansia sp. RSA 25]